MRRISIKVAFPVLLGLASTIAVACGDGNPSPSDEDSTDINQDGGGEPGSGGSSADGSGSTSNAGGSGGSANDGSGSGNNNGGEGGQVGSGGGSGGGFVEVDLPDCDEEPNGTFPGGDNPVQGEDCWDHAECKGVASEQFLNRCSGTCVLPFDNEARIVGFDGTLPPL